MSGADAPFNGDPRDISPKETITGRPIEQIMEADLWANIHYPQMWVAKTIATSRAFLDFALDNKIAWREFSTSKFPEHGVGNIALMQANKVHKAYGQGYLDRANLKGLWRVNVSNVSEMFYGFFDFDGNETVKRFHMDRNLSDLKKRTVFYTLLEILKSGEGFLKSENALEIAKNYRNSLRGIAKMNRDPSLYPSLSRQLELHSYWDSVSSQISSGVNTSFDSANAVSLNPLSLKNMEFLKDVVVKSSKVTPILPVERF